MSKEISPPIVFPAEWQAAHDALLAKEKAATLARDALAAERRRQPMVKIDKPYVLEGPAGNINPTSATRLRFSKDQIFGIVNSLIIRMGFFG